MASADKEARRQARIAERDVERARRREAFDSRNIAAAQKQQTERQRQQTERQEQIRQDRVRRQSEFETRNQAAGAAEPDPLARFAGMEQETATSGVKIAPALRDKSAGAPDNKELGPGGADALDAVPFASTQAKKKAAELGLSADNFKRRRRTSDHGFNVDDVERIAGSVGTEDDDEDEDA